MKLNRILALVLCLCMLTSISGVGNAVELYDIRDMAFELVEDSNLDLFNIDKSANELALEKAFVDENGMIPVFIVMDGQSVLDKNKHAVLDQNTKLQMQQMTARQMQIVSDIENRVLDGELLEVTDSYTWLFNGVAANIPYESMGKIAAMDGVAKVVVQPVYELYEESERQTSANLFTISDGEMIGREEAWDLGYTGKGMKIAVIDTGLDVNHPHFAALSDELLTETSATRESIEAYLGLLNVSERSPELTVDNVYYNSKVVFGYNYCDNNFNISHYFDGSSDHGTHVAGIAAANRVEGSEVVGVAPDAQLYIMKIYGANGGGFGADIIAALEDALIMGVDVVNMSLGTNAGFPTSTDEFINSIYASVAETNTVLSVAAGNNYSAGLGNTWGTNLNQTMHPDNSVISEPGIYQNCFSVASVENTMVMSNYIKAADGTKINFVDMGMYYGLPEVTALDGEFGYAYVGFGTAEEYEGLDLTGKVALVQRGNISFNDKCANAEAAGAVACFVYNNTEGEFGMDMTNTTSSIPCVSITMADGELLVSLLEQDPEAKVSVPEDLTPIPNALAYTMSDFSSWGVSPDLSLEPDITAPGGFIYSTTNDGGYGVKSGTSMSAPNIAGLVVLVMQYAKEHFEMDDYRTFVQNLLMSTSVPVAYGEDSGLYYSPRKQGSGLANGSSAITTSVYLTVAGCDTPKVALGDDKDKTGVYEFTFTVTNFGDGTMFYSLDTVVQTEDVTTFEQFEGKYFMSGNPYGLSASSVETSGNLFLTHDLDNNGLTDSRDAYLLYLASQNGEAVTDSFRYDLNGDETVEGNDVQAYLDALVGNETEADLSAAALKVEAGESVDVSVNISLSEDDKLFLDTYYPNGGYVEGFTFLNALNGGVDLSLPYMGFFGDWDAPDVIDDGDFWEMDDAAEDEVIGNQYVNVLWTNFYGEDSYYYPGANVYVDEPFDMSHISVSPNDDGYFDTIDDIYTSLLRNAADLTYRFTNMDTGEVYFDGTVHNINKSCYNISYEQIIPNVMYWYSGEIGIWDWTDKDGNSLPNNTQVLVEVIAKGAYEGATSETWAVPVTVDIEAPELLDAQIRVNELTGEKTLELSFRDNLAISVAAVTSSNGQVIYGKEGVEDVEPDENGYQNHTMTFDITEAKGKLMILLSDYALNKNIYAMNIGGEGAPYGDLVAYQYDLADEIGGWASFSAGVEEDEVIINNDYMNFVCAEYVGGYIFAQTETGDLYGFRYEDMLKNTFEIESAYIARLDNIYQDMSYSYVEGKLYAMRVDEYEGYPTTEIYTINIHGEYYDENLWTTVAPYQEDWYLGRGGLYGLAMTVDNQGSLYVMGLNYDNGAEALGETGHIWCATMTQDRWSGEYILGWTMTDLGDTGVTLDFLQSMTYNHNDGKFYWARFDGNFLETVSELYIVDPAVMDDVLDEDGNVTGQVIHTEKVGTLSGETCAMFAPLSEETIASNEIYQNIPAMDPEIVARPILREDAVTMNLGGLRALIYDLDPWYTNYKDVIWTSSDPSVVEVNQFGIISAVSTGTAIITVTNAADETKFDTVNVEVTALDLVIEGIVSNMGSGVGNVGGACTYRYEMVDGLPAFGVGTPITAPEELNYGLSLSTSVYGRGYIWACEYGNTGMIYQIDPETGIVVDVLDPVDGDMMFGMTYSESQDTFAAIMNMYLFVDLEFTHEETEDMVNSYDEEFDGFTYHRLNLLDCLIAANDRFITNETGQGASSEIVFCGITTMEDSYTFTDTYRDFLGNWVYDGEVNYVSTQTLVLLDNVGRLWYIDEICGMTKTTDSHGIVVYTDANGSSIQHSGQLRNGMFEMEIVDDEGNVTYNVFNIRTIDETPLTDMYRDGTMPRITYHFSDIEFAGYTEEGAPMFAMSLYDYWNNGVTNELYLYVAGVGTGEWVMDYETWESYEIKTESKFYHLGNTGEQNVIASIHYVEVTGGVDPEESTEPEATVTRYDRP